MPADLSPNAYRTWMRERFPILNVGVDDGGATDFETLLAESTTQAGTIISDTQTPERERFTYISMIHAALFHHKKNWDALKKNLPIPLDSTLAFVEQGMSKLGSAIGVEHRFLSVFYLFYNPEIPDMQGKFAQFRRNEYETAFLRINKEGTLQYKLAAKALYNAYSCLGRSRPSIQYILSQLQTAKDCFRKISHGNSMLLNTSGGEEFRFLTQYFGEVEVGGRTLRGVNAGDQPWPFIIDLLFGVDLKHVFEHAFYGTEGERHYPAEVQTTADLIRYEFQSVGYLHSKYFLPEDDRFLLRVLDTFDVPLVSQLEPLTEEEKRLAVRALAECAKHYLAASNVHFQLARRHVPKNAEGEQIGSAGTNIVSFLRDGLNAERERIKMQFEQKLQKILIIETANA